MEYPVNVWSKLAQQTHHPGQFLTAEGLNAGTDHAVAAKQLDESLHVHDVALALLGRRVRRIFFRARDCSLAFLSQISNPCSARFCSSINAFGSRTRRRRYKIRTPARNLSSKLLNSADGSPAWIRTTNLTGS